MSLSTAEKASQTSRVRDLLLDTESRIWQQAAYPQEHRPDVSGLIDGIEVVEQMPLLTFPMHPRMKADRVKLTHEANKNAELVTRKRAAQYDFASRRIFVRSSFMDQPEAVIRRVITHEASHDTAERILFIPPTEYPPEIAKHVKIMLAGTFNNKHRPDLADTKVAKIGFRLTLFAENYAVADFCESDNVGEIYPTMIELITDQALIRGDFEQLNEDLSSGTVKISAHEDHPKFARTFFRMAQALPWTKQVAAFKSGNERIASEILANGSIAGMGKARFSSLKDSMDADEGFIDKKIGFLALR